MNDNKIKKICVRERIIFGITIFMGIMLTPVNGDVGTIIALLGVFLIIFVPIWTKEILYRKGFDKAESIGKINIKDFNSYNSYFYKCIANIISENKKVYSKMLDSDFPCFNVAGLAAEVYNDIKNDDMDPFLYKLDYKYYEKFMKSEKNSVPYKYCEKTICDFLAGNSKTKKEQFDRNITQIALSMSEVIKVKLYNNCIIKHESEREGYGVIVDAKKTKASREVTSFLADRVRGYYFYFTDSFISAILIAYLMLLADKVKNLNYDDEFIKIIIKMLEDVKDEKTAYKKLYELYKEFYRTNYNYISTSDENFFKAFVKMIDSTINNNVAEDEKEKEIIYKNIDGSETPIEAVELKLYEICKINELYDEDEVKDLAVAIIKSMNINSMEELFKILGEMDEFIYCYNETAKRNRLKREKDRYLKGDFSKLKDGADIKQDYYSIQNGIEFEKFLTDLFNRCGYETEHTGKAGDQGCDLIVKKNDYTYCVQAKYYSSTLSNTPVQEIVGSLNYYNGDRGVVITNSDFTKGAEELAKSNNVILIDGRKLERIIDYLLNDNDNKKDILKEIELF